MTADPTWLDIMPAIPLARGVPVVCKLEDWSNARGVISRVDGRLVWVADETGIRDYEEGRGWWRVDLDDPQGFGYALRWVIATFRDTETRPEALDNVPGFRLRFWMNQTTLADRLALARALQEVTP